MSPKRLSRLELERLLSIDDGRQIPIEQRTAEEVATITRDERIKTVRIVPDGSPVANYAFDVTPARLVSRLITERGALPAERQELAQAFRAVGKSSL